MCSYCGCDSITVIGRFMEEHVEIINASGALRRAVAGDGDVAVAAEQLGALLHPHTATEEAGLFTVMKGLDEYHDHIETLCAEHRTLDDLLDAIVAGDHSLMDDFDVALREHIHKEDNGLFPAAALGLDGDQWTQIDTLAADLHTKLARERLEQMRGELGDDGLVDGILDNDQLYESDISAQFRAVEELKFLLDRIEGPRAADLRSVADHLIRRSVWIVGGDGWAYDIGSGGLDHVLASGRNVNVLVLDTEVYSNTGGQASKATPMGAVAKFASGGKETISKDLAMQAIAYGNVYVARIAMGADPQQTLKAFREAESYDGPSLILAYSHCIAHGIDMAKGLDQQYMAVNSGHWPLMRFNPVLRQQGRNPFLLDSPRPRFPLRTYHDNELRFRMLKATDPEAAERMVEFGQMQVNRRWNDYEEMSNRTAAEFAADAKE